MDYKFNKIYKLKIKSKNMFANNAVDNNLRFKHLKENDLLFLKGIGNFSYEERYLFYNLNTNSDMEVPYNTFDMICELEEI